MPRIVVPVQDAGEDGTPRRSQRRAVRTAPLNVTSHTAVAVPRCLQVDTLVGTVIESVPAFMADYKYVLRACT